MLFSRQPNRILSLALPETVEFWKASQDTFSLRPSPRWSIARLTFSPCVASVQHKKKRQKTNKQAEERNIKPEPSTKLEENTSEEENTKPEPSNEIEENSSEDDADDTV